MNLVDKAVGNLNDAKQSVPKVAPMLIVDLTECVVISSLCALGYLLLGHGEPSTGLSLRITLIIVLISRSDSQRIS